MNAIPEAMETTTSHRKNRAEVRRVAVIGCGAVAQQMHLPVLAGHESIRLAAIVDRDRDRARALARAYGVAITAASAAELDADSIDAAVIATPVAHHAPLA